MRGLRTRLRTSGVEPAARVALWMAATGVDALAALVRGVLAPTRARNAARAAVRRRAIERAVRAMGALKGPWAKAGQFAAHRHDVIPATTAGVLASLRDRVPALPLPVLLPVVEADLGTPVDRVFAAIDAEPLGAASIAQAHRARLHDGTEVVVKIQYPWIGDALPADLRILRWTGRIALRWAGAPLSPADFDRLFDEFASGLADELDFRTEARAAAEIADNLADVPDVVVPVIHPDASGRRVLTMSWQPCVRIDDRAALAARGVPTGAVVATLARAYAKQVFVDGLFHADPHPGNLFVLDEPQAAERPRVLFVDFGLCRRLSPELRRAMRAGIHAVLKRDVDGFVARMDEMGMIAPGARDAVRDAVASMFERLSSIGRGRSSDGRGRSSDSRGRSSDSRGRSSDGRGRSSDGVGGVGVLGASTSSVLGLKDEAKRLLQETPGLQLPNDLLLYARTLSYLFALGDSLDPEVDLMQISIPYLLRFLAERET